MTLADHMARRLGRPPRQGDLLPLGSIALVAHKVVDGRLASVGLRLAEPDPVPMKTLRWLAAIRRAWRRAKALPRRG
jgi:hypothetical protein